MNQITKEACRQLSADVERALSDVAARHGLVVKLRGGKFDALNYWPKIELTVKETSDGRSAERVEFERWAPLYGLSASDYGREFVFMNERFTIKELRTTRCKRPVIVERVSDGRRFVFAVESVRL